jgi:hypothetical protein
MGQEKLSRRQDSFNGILYERMNEINNKNTIGEYMQLEAATKQGK